jgi:hypothetical protein
MIMVADDVAVFTKLVVLLRMSHKVWPSSALASVSAYPMGSPYRVQTRCSRNSQNPTLGRGGTHSGCCFSRSSVVTYGTVVKASRSAAPSLECAAVTLILDAINPTRHTSHTPWNPFI